ncbi:MAG: nickel-dependent hydrogenase large subunit [Ardenticatenaceae bacterium]|nr:nickel-dependent hydrogenase large subunit [Anaerolineales bacterium]MCB8920255.1 nickel-dependent hydrogenase large subunit [Ardenticatenaceae bacterium]MCB8991988.1 nickel-dependent hydrogenase large subunit [Ardenticatenaceae bacterium]MCB9004927.1 nickel-dependent hydrogenase large subunit [Ardenticatenaceae bacterium]
MAERIVVDPITRIEGHLRIEAELNADNVITQAYSSGTMVRGIELILKGRDPREAWAFTQRACGVCTTVHSFASIRAVEDALDIQIPKAANLIRNLMIAQQYVHDHVMHFYHLHALDWVDVVNALQADPAQTAAIQQAISPWQNASTGYFADVQKKVQAIVDSGQLSIFANAYWGHPAYKLPPEVNLLATAHYLEALDWQSHVTKIHTIFGGKNPHPNFVVGGVPMPIDVNSDTALNAERLSIISDSIDRIIQFVDQVYIPDVLAIAPYYLDYAALGEGLGNFLTWGEFPDVDHRDTSKFLVPRAVILNRDLSTMFEPDPNDMNLMKEFVAHSWYDYSDGNGVGLHPWAGETKFNYTGPKPPYDFLNVDQQYTWLKAPRWNEMPMEVGPLSRVLAMYAKGHAQTVELTNGVLDALGAPVEALFSTLGRTAARAIETKVFADHLRTLYSDLIGEISAGNTETFNGEKWEPTTWPNEAKGFGFMEAPRGALGHWVVIKDRKIDNFQMVVPTTWNASPRDHKEQPGAYEASLVGTPLAKPEWPLEILRTVHSFDPCMACAIHMVDVEGNDMGEVATGLNVCTF